MVGGLYFALNNGGNPAYFVAGNIGFGVGLIACCVSTVALSSTKFLLIPSNSKNLKEGENLRDVLVKNVICTYSYSYNMYFNRTNIFI